MESRGVAVMLRLCDTMANQRVMLTDMLLSKDRFLFVRPSYPLGDLFSIMNY